MGLRKPMKRFPRVIDKVTEKIGGAISLVALPIMLIIAFEVVSRYFFNHPTRWAWLTATHLFGVLALFGGAYALLHGRHIRVEIFYLLFGSRMKMLSYALTTICFLLFLGFLTWQGYEMAMMSIKSKEVIRGIIRFPVYPLKALIPVASFLFILQGIAMFVRRKKK
jgi:TRAP-type mannitol/chloroaromatic compound transport system permease small subunit